MTEYIVLRGDTLTSIAKNVSGNANNYLQIAGVNDIDDPNLIKVGLKLQIPDKFDRPLTKAEIPTNNRINIIDNYSSNYNYIVEGDKLYYARKGRDYWVDISDNDNARKNLLQFLNDKYQFKGYEDNEKLIYNDIINSGWTYKNRNNFKIPSYVKFPTLKEYETIFLPKRNNKLIKKTLSKPIQNEPEHNEFWEEYNPHSLIEKGYNWIERQFQKRFSKEEESLPILDLSGEYPLRFNYSTTGTIIPTKDSRRYITPEIINLNEYTFGFRNRGDLTPIDSEAAPITAFNPFLPYEKVKDSKDSTNTYLGVDSNGNFKIGNYSQFTPGDYLTRTYSNEIIGFKHDDKGRLVYKSDAKHGNASRQVPITLVRNSDGSISEGAINVLTNVSSEGYDKLGSTYGNISGGRIIVKAGNQLTLLSGSIDQINSGIESLKKQNKVNSVTVYTLDNGSYNRGLRTYDKKFTTQDLKSYDSQNNGGGNFLYIKTKIPETLLFKSDTILTPNIRTINDASYKKGHGLTNELQGVVLHHTGYTGTDSMDAIKGMEKSGVSSHVVIGYNGDRKILANPESVTFHAGESMFNGRDNVNDFMLGIEFQGDTNKKDLTDKQIQSAVEYLKPIIHKYNIPLSSIVTHKLVRDAYNEYLSKHNSKLAKTKPDISFNNYQRIINELLKQVYYLNFKIGGKLIKRMI